MASTVARQLDSRERLRSGRDQHWVPALVVAALACYLAPRILTGADTMWMVALGGRIAATGGLPTGVPFAAAETSEWPNVPVLGELVMHWIHSLSAAGLALALLVLSTITLLTLAHHALQAGARSVGTALALAIVGVGMLPTFGVVRAQMLSLVPFAMLTVLLRAQSSSPNRFIWLVVPLIAVWGNLHGGVLVGVALTGCYVVFSRLRATPGTALLVGLATVAAVWMNPALLRTARYYVGVLSNEAARRGTELWARPDLGSVFDVLMVLAALALGLAALLRGRLRVWELVATLGMAGATVTSARHGMWLLLFLLGPGALGLSRLVGRDQSTRSTPPATHPAQAYERTRRARTLGVLVRALTMGLAVVAVASVLGRTAVLQGPVQTVQAIKALAGRQVVLAPEPLAEDLAAAGVTIWVSNPIDAFRPEDQAAYLDVWLGRDRGRRAIEASDVVVARLGSPALTLAGSTGCIEVGRATDFAVLACRH
ncbi:hypothetical protein UB45_10225 [Terrabacter sp. 28]|nr:hypothetical protein UB45_10225 [Terrabacter sp. 28]